MRRSAPNIALDLAPSRTLRIGIVAVAALAGLAVLASGLGLSIAYIALVFAGVVVARAWRESGRHAGSRLALMPDGTWTLRAPRADERTLELRAASDLTFLVALTFGDGRRRIRIPVFADMVDEDTMRRLRVWLKDAHALAGQVEKD